MLNSSWLSLCREHLAPTYSQYPVAFVRGYGARLWDADGREYVDFASGIATVSLGHCHPRLVEALKEQAESLWHVSNLYLIPWEIELAKLLNESSFSSKVFFCNSGAEANEAAVKFARLWGKKHKNGAYKVITALDSFHGRTLAMVSATGQEKVKKGFEPLPEGFVHVPFNDLSAVREALDDDVVAVMVEPIQGEGGIVEPASGYLEGLRRICDENGLLLIFDEVQTGVGRCGELFAYMLYGVEPDILTTAKGLGSGFPIGAALLNDKVASAVEPGSHASTFGGNPLATRVGYEVLRVILEDGVLDNVRASSDAIFSFFRENAFSVVEEVRGKGLLIGVKLRVDNREFVQKALEKGLLLVPAGGNVVRLLPPLNIDDETLSRGLSLFKEVAASMG